MRPPMRPLRSGGAEGNQRLTAMTSDLESQHGGPGELAQSSVSHESG
jgi:hypothetical protein